MSFPGTIRNPVKTPLVLEKYLVRNEAATYYMKVEGDSMSRAGILTGDIIIVDRSLTPSSGNIIVAVLEGILVVKRFIREGVNLYLSSEDEIGQKVLINGRNDFEVWGVVIHSIRSFI